MHLGFRGLHLAHYDISITDSPPLKHASFLLLITLAARVNKKLRFSSPPAAQEKNSTGEMVSISLNDSLKCLQQQSNLEKWRNKSVL